MTKKRFATLLVSGILGLAYLIYLVIYFSSAFSASDSAEALGGMIAGLLVAPHMVLVGIATIFTLVGYFTNKAWAALTGGIIYAVSGVMFILYVLFIVPSMVLSFVGYSKIKKQSKMPVEQPVQAEVTA